MLVLPLLTVTVLLLFPLLKFHESVSDPVEVALNEGTKFDVFVVTSKNSSSFSPSKEDAVIATYILFF